MNWYKLFYLMTMADRLQSFFGTLSTIMGVASVIGFICLAIAAVGHSVATGSKGDYGYTEELLVGWKLFRKYTLIFLSIVFPICLLSSFAYIATPSKKDALLIVAGGAVGTFITSDSSAQRLPADITNFLRAKIIAETKSVGLEDILQSKDTLKEMSKEQLIDYIKKQK